MKLSPYCRMMSATSKGDRFIIVQLSGALDIVGVGDVDRIQWIRHGGQVLPRKMQVQGVLPVKLRSRCLRQWFKEIVLSDVTRGDTRGHENGYPGGAVP
jgi:hypothetical protein